MNIHCRARHWHWPDGPMCALKLSGQLGPPVFIFYWPVNQLLILNMKKFFFFIMSELIKRPTMQAVINNIVHFTFLFYIIFLTLLCDV